MWLVTGGAGYIGAHVVRAFNQAGLETVVFDDFSTGERSFLAPESLVVEGSILDAARIATVFETFQVDGVVHLAGYKYAGESVKRPTHTYAQNVTGTMNLLDQMHEAGVGRIVFSSSAAVYGTPDDEVVTESSAVHPESPYGESKLIGEWLIRDQAAATSLAHTSLRYFNVAGSGAEHIRDSSPHNLFPRIMNALSSGVTPRINGDDYNTPDGTCVRDYVHVSDVAAAHVAAARRLMSGEIVQPIYNLGSGTGVSVLEIMRAVMLATGVHFTPEIGPRRAGDPARIVASGDLAAHDLGWPIASSVESMVQSALDSSSQREP